MRIDPDKIPHYPTIGEAVAHQPGLAAQRARIEAAARARAEHNPADLVDQWTGEVWPNLSPADLERWIYNGRQVG